MNEPEIGIAVVWVFLFGYAILGSIDLGAGYWSMIYGGERENRPAQTANRYLSPTWELTNTFLVLLVVATIGLFPHAAALLGSVLLLPVGLVLLLLTIRSAMMVFAYSSSAQRFIRVLRIVSGVTGVLIPGLLLSVLPVTLGGFISMENGYPQLEFARLFTRPTEYAHLGFGLSSELFLSSIFLADYAREGGDEPTSRVFRRQAMTFGPIAFAFGAMAVITMEPEAQWIVNRIQERWPYFLLSLIVFIVSYLLLSWPRPGGRNGYIRAAVIGVVLQYAIASLAYGTAHMPYIVYPLMTVYEGATNPSMFWWLLTGYAIMAAVLFPGFVLFWRLFLKDKRYVGTK
ncbi:membrane protein [Cohnella kolymensis]|uniref:Membrane protein n=1 Tax=Cohnella kolymensis TaxID=1590652 RepID=A0ABR5A6G5_9BACL|nr:cytochrome d ubiquinol oxidase subunit II [Cohnella kolymensis]KIL36624.1 membrane protein [Cohnella kolymensis]